MAFFKGFTLVIILNNGIFFTIVIITFKYFISFIFFVCRFYDSRLLICVAILLIFLIWRFKVHIKECT